MKAAAFSLIVLTLNVAGPRRARSGWPARREAIAARLKELGADVTAFQEVWRAEDASALGAAAGHERRALDAERGLAVTSRLPIESSAARDLGDGYGVLRARLRAGSSEFDVYSARLEPGEGPAAARRLGQLFHLAEFVRAQSAERPFVLLGDLGVDAEEKDASLLLDLLEARDLCVPHGDDVCGPTLGDRRVDYALIPYSPRPPRENARAEFAGIPPADDQTPAAPHLGLRARLDGRFLALRPSPRPSGRDEALAAIDSSLQDAAAESFRRAQKAGWIPFLGALQFDGALDEYSRLTALDEEVRSARRVN